MSEDEKDINEKHIDLSCLNLKAFPLTTFEKLKYIQNIYLEGNKIRKLDDDFFPTFQHLKWFDIRNNELEEIPSTIANHPGLQVFLLDENNLQQLPVQLGSIPNLKGIQAKRNPIAYPSQEILSQGSSAIIKFLQTEWQSLQAESKPNTSCLVKSLSKPQGEFKKIRCENKQSSQANNKPVEHQIDRKIQLAGLNECMKVLKLERIESKKKNRMSIGLDSCNSNPIDDGEKSEGDIKKQTIDFEEMNSYDEGKFDQGDQLSVSGRDIPGQQNQCRLTNLSSKMLRDMWLYNIRRVLEEQEAELQRQKNKDSLKKWQQETKQIQQTLGQSGERPEMKMPYGIDDELLTMPSRKDLHSEDKKCKQKRRVSRDSESSGHDSISTRINTVLNTLQDLRKKRLNRSLSPRSEQETLAAEIKKISELQRTLNSLKHLNYTE